MKYSLCVLLVAAFSAAAVGQVWEWTCDADPTTQDLNGDGVMDWVVRGGGDFDPASLSDGIWLGGATLDTRPMDDFATNHIVADLRWKSGGVGAWQATFWMDVDYVVDPETGVETFAPIYMHLENDGTSQTLTLYNVFRSWEAQTLATITDLPNDFIDLHVDVDVEKDQVSLEIDGVDKGTYNYTAFGPANADKWATVLGSSLQLDYIRIEVGAQPPQTWPIPGDANLDCKVNILDLIYVRNMLAQDPTSGDNWQANVNGDDKINILDLIFVRNRLNTKCPE